MARTTLAGPLLPVVVMGSDGAGGFVEGGGVTVNPTQYATVSTSDPVTANGTVFTLAAGEKGFIQNLDDAAVYVKLGAGASSSSFNLVLKAGTAANDGNGGSVAFEDWIGPVSIAAATGDPRVAAWKLS